MCGIVSAISLDGKPVNKLIAKQFGEQRHRGIEGFGLFDHQYKNLVRSTTERKILRWLNKYPSTSILFHHRFPTSTENVKNACHPFSTKAYFRTNYVLVHNGVIHNSYELKRVHEAMGIVYHSTQPDGTFNDSEALLWDLALYLEGKQTELKSTGAIAFICMALGKGNKHDRLYFGRNSSPLNMSYTKKCLFLSSEGEGESIEANKLHIYDCVNGKSEIKDLVIPQQVYYQYGTGASRQTDYYEEDDFYGDLSILDEVESLLLIPSTDRHEVEKDIVHLYESHMWGASGFFVDAVLSITSDYDTLLEYREWLTKEKKTDLVRRELINVSYTLKVYDEVINSLEFDPEYINEQSYKADFFWEFKPKKVSSYLSEPSRKKLEQTKLLEEGK